MEKQEVVERLELPQNRRIGQRQAVVDDHNHRRYSQEVGLKRDWLGVRQSWTKALGRQVCVGPGARLVQGWTLRQERTTSLSRSGVFDECRLISYRRASSQGLSRGWQRVREGARISRHRRQCVNRSRNSPGQYIRGSPLLTGGDLHKVIEQADRVDQKISSCLRSLQGSLHSFEALFPVGR